MAFQRLLDHQRLLGIKDFWIIKHLWTIKDFGIIKSLWIVTCICMIKNLKTQQLFLKSLVNPTISDSIFTCAAAWWKTTPRKPSCSLHSIRLAAIRRSPLLEFTVTTTSSSRSPCPELAEFIIVSHPHRTKITTLIPICYNGCNYITCCVPNLILFVFRAI